VDLHNLFALYERNKQNATKRGIAYRLTFRQWLDTWGERILDEHRGTGDERLRLERIDKAGCFEVGNVHLVRRLKKGELRRVMEALEQELEQDAPHRQRAS
jgi:hypothetical protein